MPSRSPHVGVTLLESAMLACARLVFAWSRVAASRNASLRITESRNAASSVALTGAVLSGAVLPAAVLSGAVLLSAAVGCGTNEQAARQRFIPPEADARRALETVLDEWKSGRPPVTKDAKSEVLFVDAQHQNGAKLEDYSIVGPQPWDRGRRFVVEIKLAENDRPQKVRFVVVGIAPLLVFRQDDFDMLNNWMHPMDAADAKPQATDPPQSTDQPQATAPRQTPDQPQTQADDSTKAPQPVQEEP